jgi:hypothetical protein
MEGSSVLVSGSELRRLDRGQSLLNVIQQLRPAWLAGRTATLGVSLDGSPPSDLALLRSIDIADVVEVRIVRAIHGSGTPLITADGAVVVGDVILVRTRIR